MIPCCSDLNKGDNMNPSSINKRDYSKEPLTDLEIELAHKRSAQLVQNHGDEFLPIFERFQEEMEKITKKRYLKEMAQKVAST